MHSFTWMLNRRAAVCVLLVASLAHAADPRLGGEMKHIFVTLNGNAINLGLQGDPDERLWLEDYGETYNPPANVLNGKGYNGQYGWLAGGFINLPPQSGVFIELLEQDPGLESYEALTFAPILGTDGSDTVWQWSGAMTHNWYAADECGKYEARYSVYIGDLNGEPRGEYEAGEVTLIWQFIRDDQLGDVNADGATDLADFADMQNCHTADGGEAASVVCGCVDFDGDEDVDADDHAVFADSMTGPLQ